MSPGCDDPFFVSHPDVWVALQKGSVVDVPEEVVGKLKGVEVVTEKVEKTEKKEGLKDGN